MSVKFMFAHPEALGLGALAALAGLFAPWGPALACELTTEAPEAVRIEYNPFAVGASSGPLDLVFRNQGDSACALRLVLIDDVGDPVPALTLGGAVLEFRPRESSGLFRRDVEPGAFLLDIDAGSTVRVGIDAAVVQNAVVEAGEHPADLRLSILFLDGRPPPTPIPLRILLQSAPRAQVNIAGAAGVYGSGSSVEVVDFGAAVTGVTRRVFVQVRANTRSSLSVKSEHHGVMRHVEGGEQGAAITYNVDLDGQRIDLREVWSSIVDPPRTLDGLSLPLDFTLGQVGGQMSGRYVDLLTIDISPL